MLILKNAHPCIVNKFAAQFVRDTAENDVDASPARVSWRVGGKLPSAMIRLWTVVFLF